ncbi:hypothetical protein ACFLQG_00735 [Candidatus Zixiibacteriota bacterium]
MISNFDPDFIIRTLKTSGIVLLISFVFGFYYFGFYPTLAFFSGGIWGMINLILIMRLVKAALRPEGADLATVILTGLVKFPLLYASGYFLLNVEQFDVKFIVYGFTLVMIIMVLKAIGRLMLGMDTHKNNTAQGAL